MSLTARSRSKTSGGPNATVPKAPSSRALAGLLSASCSIWCSSLSLPTLRRSIARTSWNTAAPSSPAGRRRMLSYKFFAKINTKVPKLPYTGWRAGLRIPHWRGLIVAGLTNNRRHALARHPTVGEFVPGFEASQWYA